MTFIVGAFSLVTALLWKSVIDKFVNKYVNVVIQFFPSSEYLDMFVASSVTIVAIITIITLDHLVKEKDTEKS